MRDGEAQRRMDHEAMVAEWNTYCEHGVHANEELCEECEAEDFAWMEGGQQ